MKKQCLIIFGLAFILRLCVHIFVFIQEERSFGFGSDSESYEELALRMIEYRGYSVYPDSSYIPEPARPPGYPFFIWSFYKLFGQKPIVVTLFQALLDSIVAVLIFITLAPISQAAGFIGGLIYALNPHQILYTTQILSETTFTFFLFLSIFVLLPVGASRWVVPTMKRIIFSSVLLGIATYIRTIAIYFPIFICGWLIINKNRHSSLSGEPVVIRHSAFSISLLYLLIFISILTPWMIRNYKCFGTVFFSTIGDINVAFWNAAPVIARIEKIGEDEVREKRFFEILKEKYNLTDKEVALYGDDPRISTLMRKEGLKIILKNPGIYVQEHLLGFVKVFVHSELAYWARLFYGYQREELRRMSFVSKPALRLVLTGKLREAWRLVLRERIEVLPKCLIFIWLFTSIYELIVYILGVRGAIFLFSKNRSFFWLVLITIFYLAFMPGPVGDARFRVPIEPFLAILAGFGAYGFIKGYNVDKL